MNDNLETLLYRSGLTASGSWDQMDQYDREAVLRLLKMTVEECIRIIKEVPPGYNDYRSQIEDSLRRDTVEAIWRYFGDNDEQSIRG